MVLGQIINTKNIKKFFYILFSGLLYICTFAVFLDMIRNGAAIKHLHFLVVCVGLLVTVFLFAIKQKKSFYKVFLFIVSSLVCLNVICCVYNAIHQQNNLFSVQIYDMAINNLEKEDIEKIEKMNCLENVLNGYNVQKKDILSFYQETEKYSVIEFSGKITNTSDKKINGWSYCIPIDMFDIWYERRPSDFGNGIEPDEAIDVSVVIIIDTFFDDAFLEKIFKHIEIFAISD